LVFSSIHDSTTTEEAYIQNKIKEIQSWITPRNSSIINKHFKLQINTLQNAPRDKEKLEQLLKSKEMKNERVTHLYETQRLLTEIEMLKFVLCLVSIAATNPSYASAEAVPDSDFTSNRKSATNPPAKTNITPAN
jgi:hypothetical protein